MPIQAISEYTHRDLFDHLMLSEIDQATRVALLASATAANFGDLRLRSSSSRRGLTLAPDGGSEDADR
jgi:hypothetical protein